MIVMVLNYEMCKLTQILSKWAKYASKNKN
jgi:hypothetical protein